MSPQLGFTHDSAWKNFSYRSRFIICK
jgi:hypothetical protein